jgi:outer membrane lipoprotein-sorting protein
MKKLNLLIVFFLFTGFGLRAQTVDEVIEKHIQALGGLDKLSAIKSVKMTGKFAGGGGFEAPVTLILKRPDMVRMETNFQGNAYVQAFDGTTAWEINPWSGKKEPDKMPAERVKEMREMADIDGALVNYKQKGSTAELIGKDDMEGSEVYKIKLKDKDGDITYYFLDTQSYLILKDSKKRKVKEKEIESETYYGNYKEFGGVMMPMALEFKQPGSDQSQKGTMENVEVNVDVDETIFKMPEVTK